MMPEPGFRNLWQSGDTGRQWVDVDYPPFSRAVCDLAAANVEAMEGMNIKRIAIIRVRPKTEGSL